VELDELIYASGAGDSTNGFVQLSIETVLLPRAKATADAAVAGFVYAEGVPFAKTESPYFQIAGVISLLM
jgi:hypothetical protein